MSKIYTLITDIEYLLTQRGWVTSEIAHDLGAQVSRRLSDRFQPTAYKAGSLRLSRVGPQCPHALWCSVHKPELAQKAEGWAENKFAYGDLVEAQTIAFAKAAGHLVTGEQDEVFVDGIPGHRDCIIDGCVVDVKSCNSRSFADFKARNVEKLDDWGYLSQLDAYLVGSLNDPLVTVKDRGFLLAVDKVLGHMYLYEHVLREHHICERIRECKEIVAEAQPPACRCEVLLDGQSGNVRLGVKASYNSFKYACFPNLRCFLYSDGPRYLTKVVRQPYDPKMKRYITEVDKNGKTVYN